MANYDLAFPGAAIDAILTTAYDLQNAGYIFKGSATNWSGTPTQRTWLLAPAGFSGYGFSSAIPKGSIGICKYNGSAWSGDLINVVTIDNYPTHDSTNAVTSGGMWQALDDLADGIWDTLQSFIIEDGTTSAQQADRIKLDVKMTDGQQVQHLISSFGILAATTTKAGLMSAADKAKVDAFLDNLRSLSFTDTTPGADAGTKIVETLKATIGGTQETITALTILAATTSKAGLLSASDKAYIDGLPTSLSSLSTSISNLLAMLGYYECSTAAGTAAKTVSASGYVLTTGGCIRIKMNNANTADSVTLNINSTGAKALYYDGAQASSSNSWDAGDVLEVFYDGTQYQCASGGGGGTFASGQKVSDMSIQPVPMQGSDDITTSGALYDVYHNIIDGGLYLNLESGTKNRAKINNANWNVGGSYYCGFIPITAGKTYTIKANAEQACTYAFMTSNVVGSHSSAVTTFADGYTKTKSIAAGLSVDEIAPQDAQYIYIYRADVNSATSTKFVPEYILQRNNMKYDGKDVTINPAGTDFTATNLQSLLPELDIINKKVIDKSTFTQQYIGTYGLIYDVNNYLLSPPFVVYKGDTVTITGIASQFYSTRLHIVEYLGGYTKNLVAYTAGNMSYTAPEMKVIQVSCPTNATITIVRSENRIDDIEELNTDAIKDMFMRELIGDAIKILYTLTVGSYYKSSALTSGDNTMAYTSPIPLKNGETVVLIEQYNRNSTDIFNLSDSEGNILSAVSKIKSISVPSDGIANGYIIYKYTAMADCYIVVSCLRTQTIYKEQPGEVQEYFNKVDSITVSYDILDMYATRETENMLRQITYGYNGDLNMGLIRKAPLCLIHCSDIHNNTVGDTGGVSVEKNSIRIAKFAKNYQSYIHDVIHTGDSVYATYGGEFPWTANEDVAKFLNVIGNHDIENNTGWPNVFSKFIAPYAESWGITLPENAAENGLCYYYKDYTSNNVRLIVLMDWNNNVASYINAENTWLQSVLADAKTQGLTVVCAAHVSPQKLDLIEGCTFNSWECEGHGDAGGNTAMSFASTVDDFIQGGGNFACWLCGHTHFDMVGTLHSYPEQLVIIVENASCWSKWNTDKRVGGTLSQDCFNVMTIDTTLKRVNVMRIGSNFASAIQHKGAFSYDYGKGKLLNCY